MKYFRGTKRKPHESVNDDVTRKCEAYVRAQQPWRDPEDAEAAGIPWPRWPPRRSQVRPHRVKQRPMARPSRLHLPGVGLDKARMETDGRELLVQQLLVRQRLWLWRRAGHGTQGRHGPPRVTRQPRIRTCQISCHSGNYDFQKWWELRARWPDSELQKRDKQPRHGSYLGEMIDDEDEQALRGGAHHGRLEGRGHGRGRTGH